jgi:hypothetical protein
MAEEIAFGFPSLWAKEYSAHKTVYQAIDRLTLVANELVATTKGSADENVKLMSSLTIIVSGSMKDVLILAGNQRGMGAIKLARGMYEISTLAEYLQQNPSEVERYLDFTFVSSWRNLQKLERDSPGKVPPDLMRDSEVEFNRVKVQFTDARGRVDWKWSDKSIKGMAESTGHLDRYEYVYSITSEIHHMSAFGLLAHELDWISEALKIGHSSFLATGLMLLKVSNNSGLADKVNDAAREYAQIWGATR